MGKDSKPKRKYNSPTRTRYCLKHYYAHHTSLPTQIWHMGGTISICVKKNLTTQPKEKSNMKITTVKE